MAEQVQRRRVMLVCGAGWLSVHNRPLVTGVVQRLVRRRCDQGVDGDLASSRHTGRVPTRRVVQILRRQAPGRGRPWLRRRQREARGDGMGGRVLRQLSRGLGLETAGWVHSQTRAGERSGLHPRCGRHDVTATDWRPPPSSTAVEQAGAG